MHGGTSGLEKVPASTEDISSLPQQWQEESLDLVVFKQMDLNLETTGNLMDSDNDGWGWAELLTSPGYTLVLSFPIICLVVP